MDHPPGATLRIIFFVVSCLIEARWDVMRLRRSGSGSGGGAAPDAADSPPVSSSPARDVAREERPGGPAVRRGRRRRRILIAAPFVVLLSWVVVSYTAWMLQPTSLRWQDRSAEWVRSEVPFGNWLVDEGEHIYYTANAPEKGGPQLKSLPTVGLNPQPLGRPPPGVPIQAAVSPPRIKPVFRHALPGEGVWKPPARRSTVARRCW